MFLVKVLNCKLNSTLVVLFFLLVNVCNSCRKEEIKNKKKVVKDLVNELPLNVNNLGQPILRYKSDYFNGYGDHIVEYGDEIKPDTVKLMNDYTLIIFPSRIQKMDSLNYRLIGKKKDTIFQKFEVNGENKLPYFDRNNNRDFKNYFILIYTFNTHETYFILYNKQSCKSEFGSEMSRFSLKWCDPKKELLIFEDCDDHYKKYIYDVNTKTKTIIDVDKLGEVDKSVTYRTKCDLWQNNWSSIYVKKISNGYYYLGGLSECKPSMEFKLKIENFKNEK